MRVLSKAALAFLVLLAAGTGCSGGVPSDLTGAWGGEHIALTVTEAGATVEFDCAHGTIGEPIRPDSSGRFTAAGEYVREHGGPVREGQKPDAHPARFSGQVSGTRMSLEITLTDQAQQVGSFTLRQGAPPQVYKCL